MKDKMTGRVDIVWGKLEKIEEKKFKSKSQDPKKHIFSTFSDKFPFL